MVAWRYGISALVFNSIPCAHSWDILIEFNTTRETPYSISVCSFIFLDNYLTLRGFIMRVNHWKMQSIAFIKRYQVCSNFTRKFNCGSYNSVIKVCRLVTFILQLCHTNKLLIKVLYWQSNSQVFDWSS